MKSETTREVLKILERTRDNEVLSNCSELDRETLHALNLIQNNDEVCTLSREKRIDLAMQVIEQGVDIAEVVELMTWKDFEGLIASILVENGFQCTESFRRRGTAFIQGMEIDVIGIRGRLGLSIDAKMWSIRGGKRSALQAAAEKQKERTLKLTSQLQRLSQKIEKMRGGEYEFIPIIVTWLVEEVEMHEGVPIVPVFKFNSFILNFEQYQDLMVSYRGQL